MSPEEKVVACLTRQGAVKVKSNEEKRQEVPQYLQDFLERSSQSLSARKKKVLEELLCRYIDVFSKD